MKCNCSEIVQLLKSKANPKNVEGMVRFGISRKGTLGVAVPEIRKIAKQIGKNHKLAKELWKSGIHEARILAGFIAQPELLTEKEMEDWAKGFDSWDVCDQVCGSLFDKTSFAYKKVLEYSKRKEEFVKRTAFAMIAWLAVHDKEASDDQFKRLLPIIKREAVDERNFVKKAVNWALRQIGKRNSVLNKEAIKTAREIRLINSKAAKWVASNALTELEGRAVQKKLKKR